MSMDERSKSGERLDSPVEPEFGACLWGVLMFLGCLLIVAAVTVYGMTR